MNKYTTEYMITPIFPNAISKKIPIMKIEHKSSDQNSNPHQNSERVDLPFHSPRLFKQRLIASPNVSIIVIVLFPLTTE